MKKNKITIVGLGYTGLPLLIAFHKKKFQVSGFDLDLKKIERLNKGIDLTSEVEKKDLKLLKKINLVSNLEDIKKTDIFIITVPTPVDNKNLPDLRYLKIASEMIGRKIKKNNIVIYESTVYPGCTEEFCIPIIEKFSNLKLNKDFFCGYSPERINPGDRKKKIENVIKITSGSNPLTAKKINNLYSCIVKVGTHLAPSIKVAEAAKVIENIQRDINIALVNELAMLFDRLSLKTQDVLDAASTKWNFMDFRPGLVGGHCISVDPYYLTYKAKKNNFNTNVILAGRKVNNKIPAFIVKKINSKLKKKINKVLILGFSFKENVPDFRNSKVIDIIKKISKNNQIEIFDPVIQLSEVQQKYSYKFLKKINLKKKYDLIILAVAHKLFDDLFLNKIKKLVKKHGFIYDVKSRINNGKNILAL
jgi:UDP-N-acetyl-D-galactosamine dehydrogenase